MSTLTDIEHCIEKINSNNRAHIVAIDRMIAGPLDLANDAGIPPIKIIAHAQNYRLLTVDTWTKGTCQSVVVGYVRYSTTRTHTLLDEFEIFQEYRGRGHGLIFARALLEYKGYGGPDLVEPAGIDGSEAFWIRVLGTDHFAIAIEQLDTSSDNCRAALDTLATERRYSTRMREYCHAVLDALLHVDEMTTEFFRQHPDDEYYDYMADVRRMVEASDAWQRIHRKK
jgi:hypothetical protein